MGTDPQTMAALPQPPHCCEVPVTFHPCSGPWAHLKEVNGHLCHEEGGDRSPEAHRASPTLPSVRAPGAGVGCPAPGLPPPRAHTLHARCPGLKPTPPELKGRVIGGWQLDFWAGSSLSDQESSGQPGSCDLPCSGSPAWPTPPHTTPRPASQLLWASASPPGSASDNAHL